MNVCKECADKIDVRSRVDNIKKFYNKFGNRYTLITDKNKFNLLQVNTVQVKCNRCNKTYTFILNRLLNKMEVDFCDCKGE